MRSSSTYFADHASQRSRMGAVFDSRNILISDTVCSSAPASYGATDPCDYHGPC